MTNGKAITPEIMKDRTKKFAKKIIFIHFVIIDKYGPKKEVRGYVTI
jgi:hypothetical protein